MTEKKKKSIKKIIPVVILSIIVLMIIGWWIFCVKMYDANFNIRGDSFCRIGGIRFSCLLVNSFILSALYVKTNNLWICVMTHSLINAFSQLMTGGNQYVGYFGKVVIVAIAIILVAQTNRKQDNSGFRQ